MLLLSYSLRQPVLAFPLESRKLTSHIQVKAAVALEERMQPFVDACVLDGDEWDADTKSRRIKAWEDAMTSEVGCRGCLPARATFSYYYYYYYYDYDYDYYY